MGKDTKIVHVAVVDGEPEMIRKLAEHLRVLKESNDLDIEFIITNDKVEVRDVKYLLEELIKVYKKE